MHLFFIGYSMSSFKEQLARDVKQVFINTNEFADYHILDGIELDCVVNSNSIGNRQYNRSSSFNEGIFEYDIEVIYKFDDYPYRIVYGNNIEFDGVHYKVINFAEDDSVCTLKLVGVAA